MPTFWVEGKTDKYFLKYYLTKKLKIQEDEYKTECLKGYSQIINMVPPIRLSKEEGELVILLDGDVKKKEDYKKIKKIFDENELDKVFYIEPDLETFLFKSISHDIYIDCFKTYEKCIQKKLSSKSRLYAYWEARGLDSKQDEKEGRWKIFNLNNPIFNELDTFLKKVF